MDFEWGVELGQFIAEAADHLLSMGNYMAPCIVRGEQRKGMLYLTYLRKFALSCRTCLFLKGLLRAAYMPLSLSFVCCLCDILSVMAASGIQRNAASSFSWTPPELSKGLGLRGRQERSC